MAQIERFFFFTCGSDDLEAQLAEPAVAREAVPERR
jgi:hypothetical protein